MLRFLLLLAIPYLGALVLVFVFQRRLLYLPSVAPFKWLKDDAAQAGFVPWENSAGSIIGWKKPGPTDSTGRILIIHGNAGSAVNRVHYADPLLRTKPMGVYILEYPGYGARPGSPNQSSLITAGREAMELLKKDGPVYIMAESLGTGLAAYLAGTYPESVRGMLLFAPYHDLGEVAQAHMPVFPARWLLRDRFPAADYLKTFHGPIVVILAEHDSIVPNRFGRELFDAYQGPKDSWVTPGADHNDLLDQTEERWARVLEFWRKNESRPAP